MKHFFNIGDQSERGQAGHGGQVPFGLVPPAGTKISHVQKRTFPSGQVVEHRHTTGSKMDEAGNLVTKETTEVFPPLADGSAPEDISEIVQCSACLCLISRPQSLTCQVCHQTYCQRHAIEIALDGESVAVCQACTEAAKEKPWWKVSVR